MMRSFIFFVEGIHDANCVARILLKEGFKEINRLEDLPQIWKVRVPTKYPFIDDRLDRFIPMPAYFQRQELYVALVSSNGAGNIINDIDLYLSNMNKGELRSISGVCAIFDADDKMAEEAFNDRLKKYNKDRVVNKKDFLNGNCKIRGEVINLYYYLFPDNYNKGNLENFLLEGAGVVYKDLLSDVDEYINKIDDKHKYNWSRSSENKVKVGCIANVFQPGGANQTSIRYDDWISDESIRKSKAIRKFYNFIINILEIY